jgi:aromatic ring-cleaving dioxygenase
LVLARRHRGAFQGVLQMTGTSEPSITGFHAHVYFNAETIEQARILCEEASSRFGVAMGRMHRQPVGPHPDWSCQLSFGPEMFGKLVPWLALHRGNLVVFTHPVTGNDLADHRDHAIWMGAVRPLDLSVFDRN